MRDALDVIDTELADVASDVRVDLAARLRAGGRIVATRDGVTTVTYCGEGGVPVTECVSTADDLEPRPERRDKARAA